METIKTIEAKLLQFLSGEISRADLYKWTINLLHKMLGGDIFEIKNLQLWGIITKLAEVSESDVDDSYCDESIHSILRILTGEECASFTFAMQIPQKYVVDNLSGVDILINNYDSKKHMLTDEVQNLKLLTQKKASTYITLYDLLEIQITDILKLGYGLCEDYNELKFELGSTLFLNEDETEDMEKSLMLKVAELYKCYKGEKSFLVTVVYHNGMGNVSIQV